MSRNSSIAAETSAWHRAMDIESVAPAESVPLDLTHLGERMRQSGHLAEGEGLTEGRFRGLLAERIAGLDVEQARRDVETFVRDRDGLAVWSQDFFLDVVGRIGIE